MNLDRFSAPLAGEKAHSQEFINMFREEADPEVLTCCGCGLEIDESEERVESKLYDDDFMHELDECIIAYYAKENAKDLLHESKSLKKAI